MSAPDGFEDDLLHAMARTGEGFGPHGPAGLAARGLARGRRRWRRRSAAAAVGGAAALALVGTGAVYLTDGSPAASRPAPAASGAPDSGGTASPTPGSSPSTSAGPARAAGVSGEEVLAAFRALLPEGRVSNASAAGTDFQDRPGGGGSPGAALVLDDGRGGAHITISIARLAEDDPRRKDAGCPDKKYVPYDACTESTLPDGGRLTVFQGYEYPDRRVATKRWFATLLGKDGRLIELNEWNAVSQKGGPVSRATPPLTPEQLKAVVVDTAWDRVVTALAEPVPVRPGGAGKEYTQEEILAITAGLLPAGLKQTETGGQPGFADFVVNDGKGKSLVEINVQDWSKDPSGGGIFGGAETLPDGTRVVVRKQPGKLVRWTVDTLRPDGLRVVVSASNSGSQVTAATRTNPALTVEQLRTIALAPDWKLRK
ncbi:hypothetical protein [Streptomyces sp. NRRL S-495]|uniref:hypothetical protein n=1 Tax=Streptomyces sp. NRRL S-495 TaxID=1609133 RepID=UPI0005F9273C|nr:hypothetical protein [Streptomyces sp. NRRL S-495]KJY33000.1 hypothetical protein VR45_20995 [Streptomyces sp. NRRL S-495]